MLMNDVKNKDEICSFVISELKNLGIKYRKDKKNKFVQEKRSRNKIFNTPLHLLELSDVILANGGIAQVPRFVSDACQRILEHVETEGLFRKAGSTARQREIRASLETGKPLGTLHHVIDVANVLKLFFRELPEPLLPPSIQESLLRALLCGQEHINAILMTCLLLPSLTINTLAFFMQFLKTVSVSAHLNKMCSENLAIIFTPGLMPLNEVTGVRFNNHVKVVQILIEQAEMIGFIPYNVIRKLELSHATPLKDVEKKKKKRRSGSLTRMFNGLKKIVGAIGSAENLDNTIDNTQATPCLTKSAKKRKNSDISAFSAKKRKELMSLLPENGGLLPNTPSCAKETKKTRLSLGGRKNLKFISNTNLCSSMERRWSVVGSGWAKKKQHGVDVRKELQPTLSPVISLPCIIQRDEKSSVEIDANENSTMPKYVDTSPGDSDFIRISKSEYEEIKERVSAIETRISKEFGNTNDSFLFTSFENHELSGPERVLNRFERTIEETEDITSPTTDHLAKRLSRELKIRRSDSNKIIRSPSARKIGTIRRRSKENIRLSRNKTWHVSDVKPYVKRIDPSTTKEVICQRSNLKRGRPNTVQTGLHQPVSVEKERLSDFHTAKGGSIFEDWTAGEQFFNDKKENSVHESFVQDNFNSQTPDLKYKSGIPKRNKSPRTPALENNANFVTVINVNEAKTPMLPPRSAIKKSIQKTPMSANKPISKCIITVNTKTGNTPAQEAQTGRASIARLRSQNAGMVMAKAKLFDGLGSNGSAPTRASLVVNRTSNAAKREKEKNMPVTNENAKVMRTQKTRDEQKSKTPRARKNPKSPLCANKKPKAGLPLQENNKQCKIVKSPRIKTTNTIVEKPFRTYPKSKRLTVSSSGRVNNLQHSHTFSHRSSPRFSQNIMQNSPRLRYHSESVHF